MALNLHHYHQLVTDQVQIFLGELSDTLPASQAEEDEDYDGELVMIIILIIDTKVSHYDDV